MIDAEPRETADGDVPENADVAGSRAGSETIARKLPRDFYDRPALTVAREALGMVLVWHGDHGRQAGRIVEVEAYDGPADAASHARSGPKGRSAVMFGPAGYAYVYLIYGMHHCLNFVTGPEGYPAAVLIRGLEPLEGIAGGTNGPGRLCRILGLDRTHNGLDFAGDRLYLEDRGLPVRDENVVARPRIGIAFAGEPWISQPWRLYERGNRWVSKR
jgi:DNA-3-methyladenine glycosylase